jgi:ferritin-like metal-binding protein YciE
MNALCSISNVAVAERNRNNRAGLPLVGWAGPIARTREDEAMSIFSKDIKTMDDLFVHTLRDIYYAEKQILKALPDMIDKATHPDLREGLQNHLGETKGHVERVEEVFRLHGAEAKAIDCPAIDGILKETRELVGDVADPDVLDAAIIAAAQAVEHYEITRYGTLVAFAKELGREDCAAELQANLDEEHAADEKLTEIAEDRVNDDATVA